VSGILGRFACRVGLHDAVIIAYCDLPDDEDDSGTCTSCEPLQECRRCHASRTWGEWMVPGLRHR
jgi:hypothetical protein